MTAPTDTTDAPDLFRRAVEVMGYEIEDEDGLTYIWSNDDPANMCTMLDDEWNILRLICEWIEARGGKRHYWDREAQQLEVCIKVSHCKHEWMRADAPTLPLAAARWVCEHGDKITEETT